MLLTATVWCPFSQTPITARSYAFWKVRSGSLSSLCYIDLSEMPKTSRSRSMFSRDSQRFCSDACGHTTLKTPVLVRSPKLTSLVKWRLTDWIEITGSNPNSCASLEYSGTRSWRCGLFVSRTSLAQQEKCCRTWNWSGKMI